MSYSRFSHSCWYTYWSASDSDKKKEQIFAICPIVEFTYSQLKSNLTKCLMKAVEMDEKAYKGNRIHTKEEIQELKKYMKAFIKDVELKYRRTK